MKLYVKRIIFIVFMCLGILSVGLFRTPLHFQTDLTSFVNTQNEKDWPIAEITNTLSSVINVVIESSDQISGEIAAQQIRDIVNSKDFDNLNIITNGISPREFINIMGPYKNVILGNKYREILKNGNYQEITKIAENRVGTSVMPNMLPLSIDPFMLMSDYMSGINSENTNWILQDGVLWQYRAPNNYYMLPIRVNVTDNALLADTVIDFQKRINNLQNTDVKIYVGGAPVHTAQMYNHSKIEIGALSLIAIIMVFVLNYMLFKKTKTMIPIGCSLAFGYLAGTVALFLCFANPHILVFVFGTTLIGLGIDYSFHTINCDRLDKKLNTNISHSLITTIICFIPLMFASVDLLRQISVFTITGLITIYAFIKLFVQMRVKPRNMKVFRPIKEKYRPYVTAVIAVVGIIACCFARIENNMSAMYKPTVELAKSEKIIGDLNQSAKSAFLIVRGHDIQSVLETEESLHDDGINFFGVSNVIPSLKRQNDNQNMVRQLYKYQSLNIKKALGLKNKPQFTPSPELKLGDVAAIDSVVDNFLFAHQDSIYSINSVYDAPTISNENVRVVVPNKMLEQTMMQYSQEAYRLLIVCSVGLLIALFVLYRWRAFVYLMPSLLGVVLSIGMLTVLDMPITFFHLLSLFIVIGLGLDYAIFHINSKSASQLRPVLYSFLTSFIGFGLLAFTSFFLIAAMGITLAMGIGIAYLTSLYLFRNNSRAKPLR